MSHSRSENPKPMNLELISDYVSQSSGLDLEWQNEGHLLIHQRIDTRTLRIHADQIEEVISRLDSQGNSFLQVNFVSGKKILLTAQLVGFKPAECVGLSMEKLPKVVTTPDLLSVVEAIDENLRSSHQQPEELEVLRKVFGSVLKGAEEVGFSVEPEKAWLQRLSFLKHKATA